MSNQRSWEDEARNWLAWARTPGLDVFSYYAPSFFDEIVPEPTGRTLEIGCGEGRVARELVARRHNVIAVDASRTLVQFARDADAQSTYLAGTATSLPFLDAAFDAVVAYNSLQTMTKQEDMASAVNEAARVLAPTGHLSICVAHPMTDVGRLQPPAIEGDVIITGSYFERERVDETVSSGGLTMTFRGWTHTLEDYARALESAGLVIETIREPMPAPEQISERPSLARWGRVPLFLFIRAVKRVP